MPPSNVLLERLNILFSKANGIRVDDVPGVTKTRAAKRFLNAVKNNQDESAQKKRSEILLGLGKKSMELWQEMYNTADPELKAIFDESNFNPCREPFNKENTPLHDGYRIDLIYKDPNAVNKAKGMISDYQGLGYQHCKLLSPEEVMTLDPSLSSFCEEQSKVVTNKTSADLKNLKKYGKMMQ